ncbi:MAG: glycosyltransferase [Syntrophobacteraceae bacterium]
MKLVHVVPSIFEEASGPSYSVVRLCESLITQGLEVTLAALDWGPLPSPPPFLKTFSLGLGPRRLGRSPAMLNWLADHAHSRTIDLIHNHSLWMMPNVYPGRVARKYDVPLVVSPRGTLSKWAFKSGARVKRVFWPLVQKPALAATACFHATAESEFEDIRRMGFRQPACVIPNGIDIPPPKLRPHTDARTLLFLGRIHPVKGVDMLLRAWAAVEPRFPEWELRIAGPNNNGYLPKMQSLAEELGLKRVVFCGPLYGDTKQAAYREAELFVLPTHSENFGITVAESLAAGTPAIVTKGAPWSSLERNRAGWWIDIGVDPLVACLEEAMSQSRSELINRGRFGREWMVRDYSWARIGQMTHLTYRWLLFGGETPAWVRLD